MECNLVWNMRVISKRMHRTSLFWSHKYDLRCTICTKWSSVYHFTASILNCKIQLLKYMIFKSELIFYWSSIWLVLIYKKSSLSFSCNVTGSFKQVLKSDWLLCFSKVVSLAGKKVWLRAKNVTLYPSPVINE